MSIRLGIDLGTTYSCMAYLKDGVPEIIINREGGRVTPSVVGFDGDDHMVGQQAKNLLPISPDHTVSLIKRKMGTSEKITIDGKQFTPESISSLILKYLKESAVGKYGFFGADESIDGVVITVPAYFNAAERQATKDAGELAKLNVLRIIDEPTASAVAYGYDKKEDQTIMVYDLGGGTFDVSILQCDNGRAFHVLAVNGDKYLGGSDFDKYLIERVVSSFKDEYDIDLHQFPLAMARLEVESENWKSRLSVSKSVKILVNNIIEDKHIQLTIHREEFEHLIADKINLTINIADTALATAREKIPDLQIDTLLLVGGSTRIPYLSEKLEEHYQIKPTRTINPDECVAMGAAIVAYSPLSKEQDTEFPPPSATSDPFEPQSGVTVTSVTSHGLGLGLADNVCQILFERNSAIPTKRVETYETEYAGQQTVIIPILEGDSIVSSENTPLATLQLTIPSSKTTSLIEVTYCINEMGIITVTAMDVTSGTKATITPKQQVNLSKSELTMQGELLDKLDMY